MTNNQFIRLATFVVFMVIAMTFLLSWSNERDIANAEYWTAKMEQCRSLGSTWDLNNQGKCVQQDFN